MNQQVPSGIFVPPKGLSNIQTRYEWYRSMRQTNPVHFDPDRRCWDIFRYEDVKRILFDYQTFSSQRSKNNLDSFIGMDPPQHSKFRSLIKDKFSLKQIQALEPKMRLFTKELLDKVIDTGEIDLIQHLANPLPLLVATDLLGLPRQDMEKFKYWADSVIKRVDPLVGRNLEDTLSDRKNIIFEMINYLEKIVRIKRKNPQDDLITLLVMSQIDGRNLTMQEVINFCFALLVAATETSTNLIGSTVSCLYEFIEDLDLCRNDPVFLMRVIEEVIRYRSPFQCINRFATADIEINGHKIETGQEIVLWLGSANRDEAVFNDADHFLLDRQSNPHLAFGFGIHHCIGAPLARLEVKTVVTMLLTYISKLKLVDGASLVPVSNFFVHSYESIIFHFDKSYRQH